jgi:acyl dehydratase
MGLNLDLIGKKSEPMQHKYDWKDTVLYALGVGAKADELDFLFEMNGPKVLPTFAVVPSFTALVSLTSQLGANPAMVVHGEQAVVAHRPIPPKGHLTTVAEVVGIYDKGKGALAVIETATAYESGEPLFNNRFSVFIRGAGGFGGERGPEALKAEPPADRAPDFEVTEATTPEQALLYRLSGDYNPLHASPQVAKMARFDRPILHGLCTYGFAGRAILHKLCAGDPARFRSFAGRFAEAVFPGDTLTTRGWQIEPNRYVIQVANQHGDLVISNSMAEVTA